MNGDLFTATGVPGASGIDSLNVSSLALINTTAAPVTVTLVVSDIGFAAPVGKYQLAASGTFQATVGSTFSVSWWADPANTQYANTSGSIPAFSPLDTFSTTATGVVQSFDTNSAGAFTATSPFSMTEEVVYTLQPNGELLNRGIGMVMTEVPEPSTWAMMLLGFAGLGFAAYRSSRTKIALLD
ncbi:MAG: PEPxxWA-CTERM sorting domain-containing protein [Roseiarcus sp.]